MLVVYGSFCAKDGFRLNLRNDMAHLWVYSNSRTLFFSSKRRIMTQHGGLGPRSWVSFTRNARVSFTRNARRRKVRRDWRNLLHHPHKPSYGDFVDASSMISHANPLHELAGWTTRTKNEDEIVATDQLGRGHQRDPHLPPRQRLHQATMRRDDSRAHSLRSATTSLLKTLLPNLENRSCTSCCGSGNPLDSTARVEMSLAELMDRVEVLERKLGDTAMSVPMPNSPCRLVRASPSSRLVDTFVELHLETKTT